MYPMYMHTCTCTYLTDIYIYIYIYIHIHLFIIYLWLYLYLHLHLHLHLHLYLFICLFILQTHVRGYLLHIHNIIYALLQFVLCRRVDVVTGADMHSGSLYQVEIEIWMQT